MNRVVRAAAAAVIGVLAGSASMSAAGLAAAQAPPIAPAPAPAPAQPQGPDLPALLHLRPDQLAAFHAVEAANRESPTIMAQLRAKAQRLPTETYPQRLDFQAELLNIQVAHAHRVWAAQRKFYAILTPEQQHTFDQITAQRPQQGPAPH